MEEYVVGYYYPRYRRPGTSTTRAAVHEKIEFGYGPEHIQEGERHCIKNNQIVERKEPIREWKYNGKDVLKSSGDDEHDDKVSIQGVNGSGWHIDRDMISSAERGHTHGT